MAHVRTVKARSWPEIVGKSLFNRLSCSLFVGGGVQRVQRAIERERERERDIARHREREVEYSPSIRCMPGDVRL
jgi:hypothetical protein